MNKPMVRFLATILLIQSCSPIKQHREIITVVDGLFTLETKGKSIMNKSSRSDTGTFTLGECNFKYAFDLRNVPGPMTATEIFFQAFKGNYHVRFFEIIHIDSKLYRFFLDSVHVHSILSLEAVKNETLFSCSSCNKAARLTFRNRPYYYPFYSTEEDERLYTIHTDTISGYLRKIYLAKADTLPSGLYLSLLRQKGINNTFSLSTYDHSDDLFRLFSSVRLLK